ncbi:hypothetical protein [Paenibacillus sp. DMB20]|uniref:hypothetical protein n=1 Tax=Paenibacillus sp. DMB20 TaxID=1642570 RepID=UPI000627773F|nr:hypothetical protein [Paenibacillus sp. DMB20]KKO52471.1 hypothetical protein XI25_20080 [Paenibacillus sp. DMB20]
MVLVVCINLFSGNFQSAVSQNAADTPTLKANEATSASGKPKQLTFTNEPVLITNTNIELWDDQENYLFSKVNKSSIQPIETMNLNGAGNYVAYTKLDEKEATIYQGVQLKGISKPGELFELGYGSMKNVKWEKSGAFGEDLYRLTGQCGPNIVCTYFLSVGMNGVKAKYLLNSEGYEADLDGDGVKEIIAVTGVKFHNKIFVIKKRGDDIAWADVNSALEAKPGETVRYLHDEKSFQLSSDKSTEVFRYAKGEDKLVRMDK